MKVQMAFIWEGSLETFTTATMKMKVSQISSNLSGPKSLIHANGKEPLYLLKVPSHVMKISQSETYNWLQDFNC